MPTHLCLTVRFLQPYCHGRGDGGEPEWPPSPLRVFQALVAAAAGRWNERVRLEHAAPALRWLEQQQAPSVVAALGLKSEVKYRLYVPDNVADKVAKSWSAGREGSIADYRTEKDVRPTHLAGEAIHYLFPLADGGCPHFDVLSTAARGMTHLGWGVDMVAANATILAEKDAAKLAGERWFPAEGRSTQRFRVPVEGTLSDLASKHAAFLNRLSGDGFRPVPPLTTFGTVGYRRATDPAEPPFAAFSILKLDGSGFRAFDPVRRTATVAGMVRHALARAAEDAGWSQERINQVVHGHTPDGTGPARSEAELLRFSYVPLPTIEWRGSGAGRGTEHVGAIRRVLIVGSHGMEQEVAWVSRVLSGRDLVDEGSKEPVALLSMIPRSDRRVQRYVRASAEWRTVTPMILPGYEDPAHLRRRLAKAAEAGLGSEEKQRLLARLSRRTEDLVRKALRHAGYPGVLCEAAAVEWRRVGFLAGTDRADRYHAHVPAKLRRFSCYHVRLQWRDAEARPVSVPGPTVMGGGRFCGFGLFAPHL